MKFEMKRTDDNNIVDATGQTITGTFKPGMEPDSFIITQVRGRMWRAEQALLPNDSRRGAQELSRGLLAQACSSDCEAQPDEWGARIQALRMRLSHLSLYRAGPQDPKCNIGGSGKSGARRRTARLLF